MSAAAVSHSLVGASLHHTAHDTAAASQQQQQQTTQQQRQQHSRLHAPGRWWILQLFSTAGPTMPVTLDQVRHGVDIGPTVPYVTGRRVGCLDAPPPQLP